MSYTIFLGKFKDGEPASIVFDEIKKIFSSYGNINETSGHIELIPNSDLFENAIFDKGNFCQLSIHRPSFNSELKNFIFDFLKINGTCYFSQELDFIKTRNGKDHDFPKDMIQHCITGLTFVKSPDDI